MKKQLAILLLAGMGSMAYAEGLFEGAGAILDNRIVQQAVGAFGGYTLGRHIGPQGSTENEVAKVAGALLGAHFGPRLMNGILHGNTHSAREPQTYQPVQPHQNSYPVHTRPAHQYYRYY